MGLKAKKLRNLLLEKIKDYPYGLEPEVIDGGDYVHVKPKRVEKKFSKDELILMIRETYKEL